MGQWHTTHYKELKHVVKTGWVTHSRLYDRRNLAYIAKHIRREYALPCLHPSTVTTNSVYLTIMSQHSKWLSQAPCREGICRETTMYKSQATCEITISKIRIVQTQLKTWKHTLINDALTWKRTDIEIFCSSIIQFLNTLLYLLSNNIKSTFEYWYLIIGDTCDKHLLNIRLTCQRSLT